MAELQYSLPYRPRNPARPSVSVSVLAQNSPANSSAAAVSERPKSTSPEVSMHSMSLTWREHRENSKDGDRNNVWKQDFLATAAPELLKPIGPRVPTCMTWGGHHDDSGDMDENNSWKQVPLITVASEQSKSTSPQASMSVTRGRHHEDSRDINKNNSWKQDPLTTAAPEQSTSVTWGGHHKNPGDINKNNSWKKVPVIATVLEQSKSTSPRVSTQSMSATEQERDSWNQDAFTSTDDDDDAMECSRPDDMEYITYENSSSSSPPSQAAEEEAREPKKQKSTPAKRRSSSTKSHSISPGTRAVLNSGIRRKQTFKLHVPWFSKALARAKKAQEQKGSGSGSGSGSKTLNPEMM